MVNFKKAEEEVLSGLEDRSTIHAIFEYLPKCVNQRDVDKHDALPKFESQVYIRKFIDRLNERSNRATDKDKRAYPKQYEAFLNSEKQKQSGAPLVQLPCIDPAQIKNLETCNVYTIEQLSEIGYSVLSSIGHGGQTLQTKAKEYLQQSDSKDEELEALKAEIAELKQPKVKKDEPTHNSTKRNGRNANTGKSDSGNK
jgi:hypothetical protein